mmetsp:Transcript_254/g.467  ORF Transcript_254/g.467 Transcript_254/m.467 type:complete len:200 (+) Transcript_254:241-840(+)
MSAISYHRQLWLCVATCCGLVGCTARIRGKWLSPPSRCCVVSGIKASPSTSPLARPWLTTPLGRIITHAQALLEVREAALVAAAHKSTHSTLTGGGDQLDTHGRALAGQPALGLQERWVWRSQVLYGAQPPARKLSTRDAHALTVPGAEAAVTPAEASWRHAIHAEALGLHAQGVEAGRHLVVIRLITARDGVHVILYV